MTDPTFVMPRCWRHFHTRHRWWCRACDRVTEDEFRDVCNALWTARALPEQENDR